jgi:hypothetical protein
LREPCGGGKQQESDAADRMGPPARRHCIPLNHCFYVTCSSGVTDNLSIHRPARFHLSLQGKFAMWRACICFREADTLWMQSKSMESVRDVSWN